MADGPDLARDEARRRLLERVLAEVDETGDLTGCHVLSAAVLAALSDVPRHCFVSAEQFDLAYVNRPLPIGRGQTISQPFIVALMTELLQPNPQAVVLEIGTGSGYQSAVLSQLVQQVYSVERIPELAESATHRLSELGYRNIEIRNADGWSGWEEKAPFDGIMVTAAAVDVPPALVRQLKLGGRLVIPVGETNRPQVLRVLQKDAQNVVIARDVLPVVFVPLVHDPA